MICIIGQCQNRWNNTFLSLALSSSLINAASLSTTYLINDQWIARICPTYEKGCIWEKGLFGTSMNCLIHKTFFMNKLHFKNEILSYKQLLLVTTEAWIDKTNRNRQMESSFNIVNHKVLCSESRMALCISTMI